MHICTASYNNNKIRWRRCAGVVVSVFLLRCCRSARLSVQRLVQSLERLGRHTRLRSRLVLRW